MFVAIEGSIACGKSTTARLLAESVGYVLILEQTDRHPFLAEFYADPTKFALETELAFALVHYHQLHPLAPIENTVSDFSPAKDLVFAEMNLEGQDRQVFVSLYEHLISKVSIPDLVFFLDLPPDILKQRAIARGRPFEMNLSLEYLDRLRDFYQRNLAILGKEVVTVEVSPGQANREVAGYVEELLKHRIAKI